MEIGRKNSPTGQRYTVKTIPKNDKPRVLMVSGELSSLIALRIATLRMQHEGLLFPSTEGNLRQPTSRNTFRTRVWRPALARAGLPLTIRMHDLRHAHASWLLAGHSQISTTQRYLHALSGADETALQAFQRTGTRKVSGRNSQRLLASSRSADDCCLFAVMPRATPRRTSAMRGAVTIGVTRLHTHWPVCLKTTVNARAGSDLLDFSAAHAR